MSDFNGDGKTDIYLYNVSDGTHAVWLNQGNGTFASTYSWVSPAGYGIGYVIKLGDFNGDGKSDIYKFRQSDGRHIVWLNQGNGTFDITPGNSTVWASGAGYGTGYASQLDDFNGDGKSDIYLFNVSNGTHAVWLNQGNGTFASTYSWASPAGYGNGYVIKLGDFNGDGKSDIYQFRQSDGRHIVWLNQGNGTFDITPGNSTVWASGAGYGTGYASQLGDFNGDGKSDIYLFNVSNGTHAVWLNNPPFPDVLIAITSFNAQTNIIYKPLTDNSIYIKENNAAHPVKDVQAPRYVVSSFDASNGIGGIATTKYLYQGLKEHQTGRGELGFHFITITAPDNSITTTEYIQDFPYTGSVLSTSTQVNGVYVSTVQNWFGVMVFDGAATSVWQPDGISNGTGGPVYFSTTACSMVATRRCYPWLAQADTTSNELSGTKISSATTKANAPDAYGNLQFSSTQSSDGFVQSSTSVFYNDITNWRLGLPVKIDVTSTTPAAFSTTGAALSATRTSLFVYDTLGRLSQGIVQPVNPIASSASATPTYTLGADSVVSTYAYDPTYGYRSSVTESGLGVVSRTTSTAKDFVNNRLTTTNALGHSEVQTVDPRFGVPLSLKGPNNLYTYWDYDGFGRKVKERRADASSATLASTEIAIAYCAAGGCILSAGLQPAISWSRTTTFDKLNAQMSSAIVYYDLLGREIRANATGFNGQQIYKDTVYDVFGRVSKSSSNYFNGAVPQWTTIGYDALGRAKTVTGPDNAVTTTTYSGFTTTVTLPVSNDGKVRTKTEKKTSTGLLDTVTDALSGKIVYKYDAFGNLGKVTTTGVDGKTSTITTTYDMRGRKIAMTDPDMGSWTYGYNTFGELISQKDAKLQTVTMSYDQLGRMISRTEPEGTSTWAYDTVAYGIGKLAKVTGPVNQYLRTYIYDSLGRTSIVGTSINGELFNVGTSYNVNTGRVESTTYPAAGGASLVVYNNYKAGTDYLESVSSGPGGTGTVYWRATSMDAAGNLTAETLGNGVTTTRTFDPVRGLLTDIDTSGALGTVQDLHYDYYTGVPNLSRRVDNQRAYTENFAYDALSRLTGVTGSRTLTYTYDSLGNFSKKSDFGDVYTYGQKATDNFAGPHAVTTVTKGTATVATYKYDKNGNQFSGGGRTTTYTSFNLPKTVASAASNMSFSYDAEHQRIMHVDNGNTMLYLNPRWDTGTHYTKETMTNGMVEHKHYIYAGGPVAMYTVTVAGSTITKATHYLHRDHLGSVQSITDGTGKVTTVYRYDPFGKQELVSGSNTLTHHDYTGHEMHNGAGFIHMNGRTYDPSLGRFMQADPQIQAASNLQSYNRYAYVLNNPLNLTDPSGYNWLSKTWKKVLDAARPAIAIAAAAVVSAAGCPVCAGAVAGYINTGTLKGAVMGAASAFAYGIAGNIGPSFGGGLSGSLARTALHGAIGGVMSLAQGGAFASGFMGGAFAKGLSETGFVRRFGGGGDTFESVLGRTGIAAVAGGIGSTLKGGSFKNGANIGAFSQLFNDVVHLGVSIKPPAWLARLAAAPGDIPTTGFSLGLAISYPGVLGGQFDAGAYATAVGGGEDYGTGRYTMDLGYQVGSVQDMAGSGAELSFNDGIGGLSVSYDNRGTMTGVGMHVGPGINFGGEGSVTDVGTIRGAWDSIRKWW